MAHTVVDDFSWFAKTIKNARSPGRGKELVFVTPQTFRKIIKPPTEKNRTRQPRDKSLLIRNILHLIYGSGWRCGEITTQVSRQTVSRYLRKLVRKYDLDGAGRKVTLNSLAISGRMNRIALKYSFDLHTELKRYEIPIV